MKATISITILACLLVGCSTNGPIRIKSEENYYKAPLGSAVQLSGQVRVIGNGESTFLIINKRDLIPLGGNNVSNLHNGMHVKITGIMKQKSFPVLNSAGMNTDRMEFGLRFVDVTKYSEIQ